MSQPQTADIAVEQMHEWVFTFGSGQRGYSAGRARPDAGEPQAKGFRLDDRYVVIRGTHDSARDQMVETFGAVWSMQYSSREKAGVDECGLIELVITTDWPSAVPDASA